MVEKRTIERFKTRSILLHWVHAISFGVLAITGGLMFFNLTSFHEGHTARIIHLVAAVVFVGVPITYWLVYPAAAADFLKETFHWDRNDLGWLVQMSRYYFGGGKNTLPPQDRINGDQKLWQITVVLTCVLLLITGIVLSLFRMSISVMIYQTILLAHGTAFIIVLLGFQVHFYLTSFHPYFDESLSSMIDGKVSSLYTREHYPRWFTTTVGSKADADPE